LLVIIREDLLKVLQKHFLENQIIKAILEFYRFMEELDSLKDKSKNIDTVIQIFSLLDEYQIFTNSDKYELLKNSKIILCY